MRADEIYQLSPPAQTSPSPLPLPFPLRSPSPLFDPPDATVKSEDPELVKHPSSNPTSSDGSDHDSPPQPSKVKQQDTHKQRRRKAPSETFNLPWSHSEQHLLEKLLTEIPAGEKQRYVSASCPHVFSRGSLILRTDVVDGRRFRKQCLGRGRHGRSRVAYRNISRS